MSVNSENKSSKNLIKVDGTIEESLPGTSFRVKTDDGKEVLAHLNGKMRMYHIKIVPGDKVSLEMSPYDDKRGRITRRL
ncbi:translation initiation factor IF-1 [Candidatus Wolfebacteria bacterium]|nr:translation initiation factor IF-1 [Candidatus Wolfebacteria bacterium]